MQKETDLQNAPALKLSLIIPVRNDGVNLELMLRVLEAVVRTPHEVLIVYDSPEDDTAPVARALAAEFPCLRLVYNTFGRGVVNAIRAGFEAARGEFVLITVIDDVGPVLSIESMMELAEGGCDLVSATRYAHGGRRLGGSLIGGVLSRAANRLFHWLAGSTLTDATTGAKLVRRELLKRLRLESRPIGWAVVFELAMKAQLQGVQLGEVPIVSIDRLYGGESSFRLGAWTGEYLRWFFWGIRHLRLARKAHYAPVRICIPQPRALRKAAGSE